MSKQWILVGRHGDIYVYRLDGETNLLEFQPTASIVVAKGERTGHAHVLEGADLAVGPEASNYHIEGVDGVGLLFAKVGSVAVLKHEEHASVELPQGTYAFVRQREWDWTKEQTQAVVD